MEILVYLIIAAVILLILLYIVWKVAKNLIINSIVGLVIMGILYALDIKFIHWFLVYVITIIFGIPGILIALILKFFGVPV